MTDALRHLEWHYYKTPPICELAGFLDLTHIAHRLAAARADKYWRAKFLRTVGQAIGFLGKLDPDFQAQLDRSNTPPIYGLPLPGGDASPSSFAYPPIAAVTKSPTHSYVISPVPLPWLSQWELTF